MQSSSIWASKSCCATLPSMKSSVPISSVATDLCRNTIVLLSWIEPKQIRAIKGRHNANSTVTIPLRWFGFFDRAFRRRNLGWQNIGWNFENEREEIIRRFHFRTLCQETSLGRENSAISSRTGSVKKQWCVTNWVLRLTTYLYGDCREYAGGTRHAEYVERTALA